MRALAEVLEFLLEHIDILDEIVDLVRSAASKDSIRAALRALKVKVSDEAMREELGLK